MTQPINESDTIGAYQLLFYGDEARLKQLKNSGKIDIIYRQGFFVFFKKNEHLDSSFAERCTWIQGPENRPVSSQGPCCHTTAGYYNLTIPYAILPAWDDELSALEVKMIERLKSTGHNSTFLVYLEPHQIKALWEKSFVKGLELHVTPFSEDTILESIRQKTPIRIDVRDTDQLKKAREIASQYTQNIQTPNSKTLRIILSGDEFSGVECVEKLAELGCAYIHPYRQILVF